MLKPKTSVRNPRALLYKRYTNIETSSTTDIVYRGWYGDYWIFDKETNFFVSVDPKALDGTTKFVDIPTNGENLKFGNIIFSYYDKTFTYKQGLENQDVKAEDVWQINNYFYDETTGQLLEDLVKSRSFINLSSSSIAKYQLNKYIYSGSFDYMVRGDIDEVETQPIKGLITPLTTMQIRYFDDSIKLDHDDFVVIDGVLYAVESVSKTQKRVPKKYNIYYATLNSIL